MKKTIFLMLTSLMLISCGINCQGEPPRKAQFIEGGGYGMQYHVTLHIPSAMQSHSSPCTKYEIIDVHMYTDKLGTLRGNEIIWKNFDFDEFPFEEHGQNIDNITVNIQSNVVQLSGFSNPYNHFNGTYTVE